MKRFLLALFAVLVLASFTQAANVPWPYMTSQNYLMNASKGGIIDGRIWTYSSVSGIYSSGTEVAQGYLGDLVFTANNDWVGRGGGGDPYSAPYWIMANFTTLWPNLIVCANSSTVNDQSADANRQMTGLALYVSNDSFASTNVTVFINSGTQPLANNNTVNFTQTFCGKQWRWAIPGTVNGQYGPQIGEILLRGFNYTSSPPSDFISLNLSAPGNTTYINTSINGSFFFTSATIPSSNCFVYNGGTVIFNQTVNNNTVQYAGASNLAHGALYNYTVSCVNGTANDTKTVFYAINHFRNTTSSSSVVNELSSALFSLNLTVDASTISSASATLFYSGTPYAMQGTGSGAFYNFSKGLTTPFLTSNATSESFYYVVTLGYSNSSSLNYTTATGSQTVIYAIYPNGVSGLFTNYTEWGYAYPSFKVYDVLNIANLTAWFNSTWANGTAIFSNQYNTSNSTFNPNKTYSAGIPIGTAQALSETRTINAWVQVDYNGNTRNMSASASTLNVYQIKLAACNATYYETTINMSVLDEETGGNLSTSTIESTFNVWNPLSPQFVRPYSFTLNTTPGYFASVCIWPEWANYNITGQFHYYLGGYNPRDYFANGPISNVSQSLTFYLLKLTDGSQVIVYTQDENGNPVSNVTVQALIYFVGNGSYKLVAMTQSDYDGIGSMFLQVNNQYYKFVLLQNGTVAAEYSPAIIVCTNGGCPPYSVTLKLSQLQLPNFFTQLSDISYSCVLNQTSTVLSCTVADSSGFDNVLTLQAFKQGILTNSLVGQSSCSSASCTLTVMLGNLTGNFFTYSLFGTRSDGRIVAIDQGSFDFTTGAFGLNWGQLGLLAGLLLILFSFFFGAAGKPSIAIATCIIGLIAGWALGLTPVSISSIVGIVIVGAMLAFKLR